MAHPDAELTPFDASSFPAEPEHECDIVMKGGITSGVIYPLAVCELAQVYRLRSVGGASAGAIAAAAAAAAEVGRATGAAAARGGGFLGLSRFPDELTEQQPDGTSLLFHLFRPQPKARRIFALLMAGLDGAAALPKPVTARSAVPLIRRLLRSGARAFPKRALIGSPSRAGSGDSRGADPRQLRPAGRTGLAPHSDHRAGARPDRPGDRRDHRGARRSWRAVRDRLRDLLRPGGDGGGDGADALAAREAATARGTAAGGGSADLRRPGPAQHRTAGHDHKPQPQPTLGHALGQQHLLLRPRSFPDAFPRCSRRPDVQAATTPHWTAGQSTRRRCCESMPNRCCRSQRPTSCRFWWPPG